MFIQCLKSQLKESEGELKKLAAGIFLKTDFTTVTYQIYDYFGKKGFYDKKQQMSTSSSLPPGKSSDPRFLQRC